jgi:uncharacterized protein YabE (DUF348 family)
MTTTVAQRKVNRVAWRRGIPTNLQWIGGMALAFLLISGLWTFSAQRVTVEVDGEQVDVATHRRTVRQLLLDLGVTVHPNDRVTPQLDAPVAQVEHIAVRRALPFQIVSDGRTLTAASFGRTPREILHDASIGVDPYDKVVLEGEELGLDDPVAPPEVTAEPRRLLPRGDSFGATLPARQLRVIRAVPIEVDDGGLPFTIRTTASTVGEALRQAQFTVYLGDRVDPSLGSEVVTGLRIRIQRSVPVSLVVDGRQHRTRTRGESVADALAELRVGVSGADRVEPALDSELYDGLRIVMTRVSEEVEVEEEIAAFDTVYVADPNLAIDEQELRDGGAEGVTRTRYRVHFENGQEIARELEDTWTAQDPQERVIAYGQKIEPKTFTAPDGTQLTYWRRIRMLASSYSAGTAGVSPSSPSYGRTYTGEQMRFGIVAVDPKIVPLRTRVFVPGYGVGDALDIGSAIRSRRIDLGYDDSNLELWNRWVDVYLLWPPPPAADITWVVPNWPRLPQ